MAHFESIRDSAWRRRPDWFEHVNRQTLQQDFFAGLTGATIVLPQAVRFVLPPLTGLAVSLVKHSSIVSVIAVFELTTEGRNIISDTYMSFEIWLTVAGLYLSITVTLSLLAAWLERRFEVAS